jgi:AcrR family transcriptional regulator
MAERTGITSRTQRPLRADARGNHERILRAATDAFGERGVEVQMADIAMRAGVAIGTVYRHFPTKEALVDALLLDRLATVAQAARQAAAAESESWAALEGFLRTVTTLQVQDRSLSEFIGGRISGSAELRQLLKDLFETFSVLVDDAKQAGQLRADVEANDIRVAMICVARAAWGDWPDANWVLKRYIGFVLDGLRAPGHTTLGGAPPTTAELGIAEAQGRNPTAFNPGRRRWKR